MADNIAVTAGSGTTVAADDVGGVLYQRVKLALGADGAFDNDVDSGQQASAASVPVVRASDESPPTGGGLSMSKTLSAASTNATSVKGSAGQVYWILALNKNAALRYLKLYDKASAPTVGSDTPVAVIPLPASATNPAPIQVSLSWGLKFSLGIAFALTTGIADSDTGAVGANDIALNIGYK